MIIIHNSCSCGNKACVVELFEPIEARNYIGVSAPTLNTYRNEGWLQGIPFQRGFVYTRDQLDAAIRAKNADRINTNVKEIYAS